MEIVKNADALAQQILQDAAARARRVREAADKECAALRAEGATALAAEQKHAEEARAAAVARLERELAGALPLDFHRTRLAVLQEAVDAALAEYLGGLSAAEVARVIGRHLARAAAPFAGRHVLAWCAGIDAATAKRVVAESLPGAVLDDVKDMPAEDAAAAIRGIVVESTDGRRRCRATLAELRAQLLDERRAELAAALFGKDAIQ